MTAPEFPRRVSVAEVIENARCELYDAVAQVDHPWVRRWAAAFDFSFVVDRDVNGSTDTSYLLPIDLGTFSIGLRANLKQKAKGTYAVKYKITRGLEQTEVLKGFGRGDGATCDQLRVTDKPRRLLNGEIGLRRWLLDVVPQIERARIMNEYKGEPQAREDERTLAGELDALSYTIEFGVTTDGSLLPAWSLTYPDKRQLRPGFNLTASEIVTHKLIVALTPRAIPVLEPADWSTILETRKVVKKGKETQVQVIVGRKVCVIKDGDHGSCDAELHSGEVREKEKKVAETKKELKMVTERQKRTEESYFVHDMREQRPDLKDVPAEEILKRYTRGPRIKSNEELARDEDVRRVEAQLKKYEAELAAAKQQTRSVIVKETTKEREIAARKALERAEAEADRETARRLDSLIQQQIIRDAFR